MTDTSNVIKTPPTLHSFVDLYLSVEDLPDLKDGDVGYLFLGRDIPLTPLVKNMRHTILVGKHDKVRSVAEELNAKVIPLFHYEDFVAVRAVSS